MAEGYCVKCKAKKPISDAVEEIMKNGRKAIKGRCPTCGAVMFKILGGKATVATPLAEPPPPPSETRPEAASARGAEAPSQSAPEAKVEPEPESPAPESKPAV